MVAFSLTGEIFNIPGRGKVAVATVDERVLVGELFSLIGQNIETDGVLHKIRGVEYATGLGYVTGPIGLLIEPLERPFA